MRKISSLCLTALAATLLCSGCNRTRPASPDAISVTLAGHRFSVEVAETPAEQEHGLMDRTSMPADHGMLFVFGQDAPLTFWMKDTLIPLDMLFFDSQFRLVAIQANAQPCKSTPCRLYPSGVPARYVLELNAGTAARIGARQGNVIAISGLSARTQ
ncbi:MAG TPA: DUF192 domain-containing protein [Rhodanobacteraceae bacterium]|jgi:uncharacterized membrane protein (UPF0127 family)|nr:DUF192 domain-containing protein [Rhodanobacteraceae bacterium]